MFHFKSSDLIVVVGEAIFEDVMPRAEVFDLQHRGVVSEATSAAGR